MTEDAESSRIDAIVADARRTRRPASRGLWIASLVIGFVCLVGFVVILLADADPAPVVGTAPPGDRGIGFASGLAIGIAIGIAVGFAIARQRGDHSSRNNP